MEKKYNEVLQKQGIDSQEIENIWKLERQRTKDSYFDDMNLENENEESESDENYSEHSEQDLAESVSLNLSPVKENDLF